MNIGKKQKLKSLINPKSSKSKQPLNKHSNNQTLDNYQKIPQTFNSIEHYFTSINNCTLNVNPQFLNLLKTLTNQKNRIKHQHTNSESQDIQKGLKNKQNLTVPTKQLKLTSNSSWQKRDKPKKSISNSFRSELQKTLSPKAQPQTNFFAQKIKPRKQQNEPLVKSQLQSSQKKNYSKKGKSKKNSISTIQSTPFNQLFSPSPQIQQQSQTKIDTENCKKATKQNLRQSMDDIRKDPTEKKSLISDIQKYHQLVNTTNIKAYMNKYLKSLPKSPNLEHPLSSKPKKPQSFDSNCTNSHPLKSLLHRASQVNQVNDSNHNSQLMQYEPQLSLQYSFRTRQGQVINNPQKVNQDAFITIPKFLDNNNQHLFAVCDGHGTYGHLVSAFIKSQLPVYLANELQKTTDIKHALTKSFHNCSNALSNTEINTTLSGSTITLSLLFHNKIFTANCGDSRAIISRHSPNDNYSSQSNYSVIELSKDHKPEQPKELARILRMGGRVEPIVDWEGGGGYLGPNRVWLQGQNFPGLAMSRSFGDSIASSVGVSPIPEITEINLEPDMKFIVIATDGIWEYIDNEECINIVGKFFDRNDLEGACDCLLNEAYKRWTYEEDTVVDDITVVVIFLKYL